MPRAGLTMTNCPGRARPGDLRRVERQHAVLVGEPRVGSHDGVDVARHNPKYTLRVMRFLRMLTNSLLAGALGAAFLTIIVLQLNPSMPLLSDDDLAALRGARRCSTACTSRCVFYLLMVGREFIGLDGLSPGWVSVRVLAWLTAAVAAAASVLMWLNVSGFSAALGESAVRRMTAGAAATSATAIVLLGLAAAHYSFGRRGSRVGAALLAIAVFGSLALPVAARGPAVPAAGESPPPGKAPVAVPVSGPRVVMILLDGASLEYVWPRTAGGRLPNFARLLDDRCVDGSGDRAADRPGSGLGRGGDGHVPGEERRAVAGRILRPRRCPRHSRCCPTTASRTCSSSSGCCAASRTPRHRCAPVRSGASWPMSGISVGRRAVAADLPGAAGPRLRR